jgi:hypothetical protein
MQPPVASIPGHPACLVQVRQDAPDRYTAEVVGLPAIQATAPSRDLALSQVREALADRVAAGQLVPLAIPTRLPVMKPPGWAKDDPLEQELVQDLARARQEDLERTLREYEAEDQGCSGTSSTPTT